MASGAPNGGLCPDWVWLNNSNVNVAKDRGWFTTYTPFPSVVDNSSYIGPASPPLPVLGIGRVEIPVKRNPHQTGAKAHGILVLNEVLHVPDAFCNSIGQPVIKDGYTISMGGSGATKGDIRDSAGKVHAYFDPKKELFVLKLSGPPTGPIVGSSRLLPEANKALLLPRFFWSPSEQEKWRKVQGQGDPSTDNSGSAASKPDELDAKKSSSQPQTSPPYTAAEKAFLKAHWDGEYKFLLTHQLKITSEEDREEGRSILRALMAEEEDDEDGSEDEFAQFEGHQADYNFTHAQLDWIEKHYKNSEQFMLSYGLKFYDNDDLEEAKAIAQAMMEEDD